jgi:protein-disulfide isomerase
MDKRFLAILGILIAGFIGFIVFSGGNGNDTSSNGTTTNHIEGKSTAKIALLEYGDYQCPVCYLYNPIIKQVVQKYKDKISFQFMHLPLVQIHKNAFSAARAAEAAGLQNKFWEMHDMIYDNQDPSGQKGWVVSDDPLSDFSSMAGILELDIAKFKTDYASSQVNTSINADVEAFNKTGREKATPAFFLNGQYVDNKTLLDGDKGPTLEKFSALIDAQL